MAENYNSSWTGAEIDDAIGKTRTHVANNDIHLTEEDREKLDSLSTETQVLDDGEGNVVISLLSMNTQVTDDGAGNVVLA